MLRPADSPRIASEALALAIRASDAFAEIDKVYHRLSGMRLLYRPAANSSQAAPTAHIGNELCDFLARHCPECGQCQAHKALDPDTTCLQVEQDCCFAGVAVVRAPVQHNSMLIGALESRASLREDKRPGLTFETWAAALDTDRFRFDMEALEDKWRQSPAMPRDSLGTYGELLRIFARHLEQQIPTLLRTLPTNGDACAAVTERAIQYIDDNLGESLKVGEIADTLKVDPAYLSRAFKADVGVAPSEYLAQRRIQLAKELLLSPLRITDVAYRAGYSSISQFNRNFRKQTGMSPKEYRGNEAQNRLRTPPH